MNLQTILENLINGNLTDAKEGAARYSAAEIADFAEAQLGWSPERAHAAAQYLIGEGRFQDYADLKDQ